MKIKYVVIIVVAMLAVQNRLSQAEELRITPEHRVWVTSRDVDGNGLLGGWTDASNLRVGDRFLLADGSEAVLHATESAHREVDSDGIHSNLQPLTLNLQPAATYNFEVAETNTYFVGALGVWVHNMCAVAEDGRFYNPYNPYIPIKLIEPAAHAYRFYRSVYTLKEMKLEVSAIRRGQNLLWRMLVPDRTPVLEPTWFNFLHAKKFVEDPIGNVFHPRDVVFARLRRTAAACFMDSDYAKQRMSKPMYADYGKALAGSNESLVYNYSIFVELSGEFLNPMAQFADVGPFQALISQKHLERINFFASWKHADDILVSPVQRFELGGIYVLKHGIPGLTEDEWTMYMNLK